MRKFWPESTRQRWLVWTLLIRHVKTCKASTRLGENRNRRMKRRRPLKYLQRRSCLWAEWLVLWSRLWGLECVVEIGCGFAQRSGVLPWRNLDCMVEIFVRECGRPESQINDRIIQFDDRRNCGRLFSLRCRVCEWRELSFSHSWTRGRGKPNVAHQNCGHQGFPIRHSVVSQWCITNGWKQRVFRNKNKVIYWGKLS